MTTDTATNFSADLLLRLQALLEFSVSSPLSDLYRSKYAAFNAVKITNYEEFVKLPLLEKAELLARPWRERLFIPEDKVALFAVTSGTTGGGSLIIPRAGYDYKLTLDHALQPALLAELGVKRVMLLLAPHSLLNFKLIKFGIPGIQLVAGDIKNIDLWAGLAEELGADGLVTVPAALEKFVEAREKSGAPPAPIKWVSLGGEGMSEARYEYLRSKLPGTRFTFRFGAAEFGAGRFYRCPHLHAPSHFHPLAGSHLFELLREDGTPCALGEAGELVHTDLDAPKALPYIRYRTGDEAALERSTCPCGDPWLLKLSGRRGFDTFRYAGATVNAEAVEAALARIGDFAGPDFRMHIYEECVEGKPRPRLELHLVPLKRALQGPQAEELAEKLAGVVQDGLYLSPKTTLTGLVELNAFGPLTIKFVSGFPPDQGKTRRIIQHL